MRRLLNDSAAEPTVYINWGKFGEYELKLAADGEDAEVLLEAGASLAKTDAGGKTASDHASEHPTVLALLAEAGQRDELR